MSHKSTDPSGTWSSSSKQSPQYSVISFILALQHMGGGNYLNTDALLRSAQIAGILTILLLSS